MARARPLAIALALGVTVLAAGARADEPPPNAVAQPSQQGPGLPVRPSRPLQLDGGNAPKPLSTGLKILVLASVGGAGAWVWRRRTAGHAKPVSTSSMSILRRVSLGMRSELVLVEVDGQRLLLGVTPSSVQTLATLADPNAEAELPEPAPAGASSPATAPAPFGNPNVPIGDRFADMLEAAQRSPERSRPRPAAGTPAVTPVPPPPVVSYGGAQNPYDPDDHGQDDPRGPRYGTGGGGGNAVEGQVRGLLGLGTRE